MKPSEAEISAAIDALKGKAGVFEKLVGTWICAAPEFDDRFASLQIRGRRGEQTVRRWPDAYVEDKDGRWDCVEATHSPSWYKEFDKQVAHVEERKGRVSGFVLVAWSDETKDEDVASNARDALIDAGVPSEAIQFVFKGRLLASLQDWRFAHIWRETLGLRFGSAPFRSVDPLRGLFRIDGECDVALRPRPGEFRSNCVYRPLVLSSVIKQLKENGIAEVRGIGAAGKTVLAEHVANWHVSRKAPRILPESNESEAEEEEVVSAGPVYYIKLGSFENRGDSSGGPVEAFRLLAAPNVLFVVDDIHLNSLTADELLQAWRIEANGSRMLRLGRELVVYEGRRPAWENEWPPALQLQVGAEDLVGVYRRLATVHAGENDPPLPPDCVVRKWLERFQGDLVVFSAAVAAKLPRLLRHPPEWELTKADAALEVEKRYLRDLDSEERRDLLGLAAIARFELGAPAAGVRSGLRYSQSHGAVVNFQTGFGDPGEFQLAHSGLGELLLAADRGRSEARDLNEWGDADASFALRLGTGFWNSGESAAAAETWSRALAKPGEFGAALVAVPMTVASSVIAGLEALDLLAPQALDRHLTQEVDDILASLLDRPDGIGAALRLLGESCPLASRRLLAGLIEDTAVTVLLDDLARMEAGMSGFRLASWVNAAPEIALSIGRRFEEGTAFTRFVERSTDLAGFFGSKVMDQTLQGLPGVAATVDALLVENPGMAETIASKTLEGDLPHVPRAFRVLGGLSPSLNQELRRLALGPRFRKRLVAHVEGSAPSQLISLFRFADMVDPGLVQAVEATISPTRERRRLVGRLVKEPESLRGIDNAHDISPLLVELAAGARAAGADLALSPTPKKPKSASGEVWWQLELDPSRALLLNLNSVLAFVSSDGDPQREIAAVAAVLKELRSAENRERLVRAAALQPPAELCSFLIWASAEAPETKEALLAHLRLDANLAAYADICLDRGAYYEHLVGLFEILGEANPALPSGLVAELIAPQRLHRLTEAGFRGPPTGWVALLGQGEEELIRAVLADINERRWHHYWRDCPLSGVEWLQALQAKLVAFDRSDLCAAPAERVLTKSAKVFWEDRNVTLGQLANALSHGRTLGSEAALQFLEWVDHTDLLRRQYGEASLWAIAQFINTLRFWQSEVVVDAVLTPALANRAAAEVEAGWGRRSATDIAGLLAFIGALLKVDVPTFIKPPGPAQVVEALESVAAPAGQLTPGHAMVWTGLKLLVKEVGEPLRLGDTPVLGEHLRLFQEAKPEDQATREENLQTISWLVQALDNNGALSPEEFS